MAKVFWIVVDGFGIGDGVDAEVFNTVGANTLAHISQSQFDLKVPRLTRWGLGKLDVEAGLGFKEVEAAVARLSITSAGNDTPTGHWELSGVRSDVAPPVFLDGFDEELLSKLAEAWGVDGVLGNCAMNGEAVIAKFGEEHMRTGKPIVYTSSDSVLQIAAHEDVIEIGKLWSWCDMARNICSGKYAIGRIARPFEGEGGSFKRTPRRRDWALEAPGVTVLDILRENDVEVIGVGKIGDIFSHRGISKEVHPEGDQGCMDEAIKEFRSLDAGLVFVNLVEFDTNCGHVRNVERYAKHLSWLDSQLGRVVRLLGEDDLLVIDADHGNDPTWPGSDHTRERVPFIAWGHKVKPGHYPDSPAGVAGATVGEWLGVDVSKLYAKSLDIKE